MGDVLMTVGHIELDDSCSDVFVDELREAIESSPFIETKQGDGRLLIQQRGILGEDLFVATFHPQAWQDDYAVPVDAEGRRSWLVSAEEALDDEGNIVPDDSYLSDELKYSEGVPEWIRKWTGPFYITVGR